MALLQESVVTTVDIIVTEGKLVSLLYYDSA